MVQQLLPQVMDFAITVLKKKIIYNSNLPMFSFTISYPSECSWNGAIFSLKYYCMQLDIEKVDL